MNSHALFNFIPLVAMKNLLWPLLALLLVVGSGCEPLPSTTTTTPEPSTENATFSDTVLDMDQVVPIQNPLGSTTLKTFTLVGFPENHLVNVLEKRTGMVHKAGSRNNRIEITYSGDLTDVGTGLVMYGGGIVEVAIDGVSCASFSSLSIGTTPSFGNPQAAVEQVLNARVARLIEVHSEIVSSKIVECLE